MVPAPYHQSEPAVVTPGWRSGALEVRPPRFLCMNSIQLIQPKCPHGSVSPSTFPFLHIGLHRIVHLHRPRVVGIASSLQRSCQSCQSKGLCSTSSCWQLIATSSAERAPSLIEPDRAKSAKPHLIPCGDTPTTALPTGPHHSWTRGSSPR